MSQPWNRIPAELLLSLSALFWSGNFVIGRALHGTMPPITLSFWRWAVAGAILLPFCIAAIRREWPLLRAHPWLMLLYGALGVAGFNSFAYLGLQETTATNALLINSTIPILILVLSRLFLGQRMNRAQIIGVLLSMLGVMCLVLRGDLGQLRNIVINHGDLWVLLAALDWAAYSILLRYKPEGLSPLGFLGASIAIGLVILAPLHLGGLIREPEWERSLPNLLSIAYVAIFASILAYLCWNQGIKLIGAARGGQFIHLMPVFGTFMALFFLGEQLQGFHLIGAGLIAVGLYVSLHRQNT